MFSPKVSIVIVTRNRVENLRRCVDAVLSVETTHDWEVVLVDNGSDDGTQAYLNELNSNQFDRPRVVTAFEAKRGSSAAKNKGWRAASSEIVAFTDDDCYVAHDYVDSILKVFQENAGIGFAGGRILLYDDTDYRITIQESEASCYFPPYSFFAAGTVQGANMAFRRAVLERIGGFDEKFGAGTPFFCEDIDAMAAVLWAGIPGVYDPRSVVYHHHGRKTEFAANKLMCSYDKGRGVYYTKYILNGSSRRAYGAAWIDSAKSEFSQTIRAGRFPRMGRSLRELSGGLRYILSEYLP